MSQPVGTPTRRGAGYPVPVVLAVPVAMVLLLVVPPAAATADHGDDDPAALAAVRRAATAASGLAFAGTQVVSTWSPGGSTTRLVEVSQSADGRRTEELRSPGSHEPVTHAAALDPTSAGALDVLAETYRIVSAGSDVVAGRPARVVEARRDGRTAARLWVDAATGLLLRQEVLDAEGELTRMTVFLDVDVTPMLPAQWSRTPVGPVAREAADHRGAASGTRWSTQALEGLDPEQWPCPEQLPGGLRLVDARWTSPGGGSATGALHLTYTDGLSGLSLFVQEGRADLDRMTDTDTDWGAQDWDGVTVAVARGAPTRVVWQGPGRVYTLVADAPVHDVRGAVALLPTPDDDGLRGGLASFARGLLDLLPG